MDASRGASPSVLAMADPNSRMVVTRKTRDRKAFSGATSADTLQGAPPKLTPCSWLLTDFQELRMSTHSPSSNVVSFCNMDMFQKLSDKGKKAVVAQKRWE